MCARNGRWILPEKPDFHVAFRNLLHAVNLRHGTDGFTSPPKEGVLRIFSPWKIWRLRPGLNPRTWVPKATTLPLDHRSRLLAQILTTLPRRSPCTDTILRMVTMSTSSGWLPLTQVWGHTKTVFTCPVALSSHGSRHCLWTWVLIPLWFQHFDWYFRGHVRGTDTVCQVNCSSRSEEISLKCRNRPKILCLKGDTKLRAPSIRRYRKTFSRHGDLESWIFSSCAQGYHIFLCHMTATCLSKTKRPRT